MSGFLYHRCPEPLLGEQLLPLNLLRESWPDRHDEASARYARREALRRQKIPQLDCAWSDVVHLSPLSPRRIWRALTEAGVDHLSPSWRWVKVPVERIAHLDAVWFDYHEHAPGDFRIRADEVRAFSVEDYDELTVVPEPTRQYFREVALGGRSPVFIFHRVPHVLVRGAVPVDDCEIFEWSSWSGEDDG